MRNVKTLALAATTLAALSGTAFAADYSDGLHKNDYKWSQFNLMYSVGEKPSFEDNLKHDYLEMEFGGRSGVVDLYGYVDVFNLANKKSSNSDKKDGSSKMFMKLAPRFSLDAMTGKDLSFGPVQEVYVATLFNWGGGAFNKDDSGDINNLFAGLGSDVMVPWLGKVGMNVYGLYDGNAKEWNGYQFSMNWFKPFVNFDNGSFISYQGYIDYQFGADTDADHVSSGGVMFNGIYWHSERYSVGYGLKAYSDVYTIKDGVAFGGIESSGVSHYFAATYKF
jgi:nucleoside-specific channel-forming protein